MNKKIIIGSVFAILVVGIGAVIFMNMNKNSMQSSNEDTNNANEILESSKNEQNNSEEENEDMADNKVLVAYFSRAGEVYNVGDVEIGNTAIMSSYIVDYLKADSFEIVPVKTYSSDYSELIEDAQNEKAADARPEIKNKITNFDSYDTIFIGYPIWWGDMPQILYTFLEEYDFSGKTVIPFNTHEGSGSSGTYNTIKSKLNNATVNTNGLAIQGKTARTDNGKTQTVNWLKELGY